MQFDIVILSYAKNEYLKSVTKNCLNSLMASECETDIDFNINIYESELLLNPFQYQFSNTHYLDEKFHYNRFMNYGFEQGNAEYVAFCNNDLEFKNLWATKMIYYMEKYNINSASPYCLKSLGNKISTKPITLGNIVGKILTGWCIVVKREWFEKLGGFDERVSFYCSDNIYNEQLKAINEKHALINHSFVNHLVMSTINYLENDRKDELCVNETKKFNKIFNQNILGLGT